VSRPVVAIVGRPNVGKSTLFNKIIGERLSIVHDTPGVTRDRIYGEAEWRGQKFLLVDTGGIEPYSQDVILSQMRAQAQLAIDSADVIVLVVDVTTGMTATDSEVAAMLIKSQKPIVLAVNKVDRPGEPPMDFYEFYNLGLGDPVAVSSVHGMGTGDLLDEVFSHLQDREDEEYEEDVIRVAVIGRPNAGKSSLINRVLGEQRLIVSDIAGTTRDAIDSYFENQHGKFVFIDTAGIRRKSKVNEHIEKYSVLRAYMAVDRSDVCLLVVDGAAGITEQDAKIAGYAYEQGKACVIAVNKWDIVEKETGTMEHMRKAVYNTLSYMTFAPVVFLSAKTGARMDTMFQKIVTAAASHRTRIKTGMLNDVLNEAVAKVQPPSDKGKRLKILYMTQASTQPPTFVVFVNNAELFHFSYQRYLENQIRSVFGLEGTPVRFITRERGDKKDT
jgi:GTP-binding protein